ncbi:MAG: aminodeoxychorismate synthase component I, partial [Nocardioidaceae bacterium]
MNDVRSARLVRRRLECRLTPTDVLRLLRDEPGLCALIGDWHRGGAVVAFAPQRVAGQADDPFDLARDLPDTTGDADATDAFCGGWIGYWGYQLGGRIERLPRPPARPAPLPDFHLAYYDHVLRYDATAARWWFEALLTSDRATFLDEQYERLRSVLRTRRREPQPYVCGAFTMTPDPGTHQGVVASTLDHITAGDIFQANLCVRLEASLDGDPLDVFCAGVETLAPRYGAYVDTPQGAVASLSPELFVRRRGRDVLTSPIKGTAPLASDVRELASSYKNRAENIMIVDLMRNDLGRVCAPGSVRVPDQPRAERHTGVWHLVSDVHGRLRDDADDADLLRATFPPGSVTGAPKIRAMRIINDLETTGREIYTGSVGYVSPCAGLELNVAIRTFEFRDDTVWLGVGGGIVADSDPVDELRECLVKVSPLLDAIGAGLDERVLAAIPEPAPSRAETSGITLGPPRSDLPRPDHAAGVFETMRVDDGVARQLDAHLARLAVSLDAVYDSPLPDGLRERVRGAAAALERSHRMRVSVVPGRAEPVTVESAPLAGGAPAPWRLVPCVLRGGMGAHKWRDRRVLDVVEPEPGAWSADRDALLVDSDGTVLETGRGTVFVVDDHGVHTPALDGRILPGVTRARALEVLRAAGVPTFEGRVTLDDVARASE